MSTSFKQYLTQLTSAGGSASPEPVTRCRELGFLRVDLSRSRPGRHKFSKSLPYFFPLPIIFLNEPKCIILELKDLIAVVCFLTLLRILNSTASMSVSRIKVDSDCHILD